MRVPTRRCAAHKVLKIRIQYAFLARQPGALRACAQKRAPAMEIGRRVHITEAFDALTTTPDLRKQTHRTRGRAGPSPCRSCTVPSRKSQNKPTAPRIFQK